ncbi:hypothetical protein EMIHUDRAFT_359397 [Emiliania huxleyi CCMP1516]|uniref:Ribosomal protein S17 n=2 Tax=Emiliania huxleyi TaxID=2903 RepID=A0A0D3I652_EMIH1|nr:hypothetical protein EMIHUDRAFT_359397 [Emiliania huxleyi CCMP1516]EOD06737.1 hypothetical protein EMIHUDRAFT_359397 [Emiliania huxleyi CCMP1516]|eukprot:XP_005759166.1 hypothetical protein EMIHUDRAFT_359397 [Emiliania huxleyi CCMP1516]
MAKTARLRRHVVVNIPWYWRHPKYQRIVLKRTRLFAHDEFDLCSVGDMVRLQMVRPLSKKKSHVVAAILRREDGSAPPSPFPNVHLSRNVWPEEAEEARVAAGLPERVAGPGVEGRLRGGAQ